MKAILLLAARTGLGAASLWLMMSGADAQTELPLSGPSLRLADEAYQAYARRDYALALQQAREALRQRPDSRALQALVRKLQAPHGSVKAPRPAASGRSGNARMAVPLETAPGAPIPPADPGFVSAQAAYTAFDRGDFAAAVQAALESVRLTPLNRDYRLLLVNALWAANRPAQADEALGRAIAEAGDDGRLAALRETLRQRSEATAAAAARERVLALGTAAYLAFENRNYVQAAGDAREALKLAPQDKRYRLLLMNALSRNGQYEEALAVADEVIATDAKDAVSLAQRGVIRQRLGLQALAREDFDAALAAGHLPVATEIGLLADLGRPAQARARYLQAQASGELAAMPGVDAAYLAVRVGEDAAASAAFAGADAAGKLPDTAYQDAAFADVRLGLDAQAIAYFKRSIDDEGALKLRMEPQMLFATRRAVAEVSRTSGAIASLTYRGAVSGLGLGPGGGGGGDSLQAGVETWWRPWGYNNGRYAEVFARAFDTLYSKEGGATGAQSLQAAVGIRYKPLSETNLVGSLSRVFSRSGGRNDWLAQIGYSGGTGGDLRVDAPAWWTTRVSAEAGRYLTGRQTYALAQLQAGRSMVLGDEARRWVLFPHLSVAADYDSSAVETSSVGAGPGISLRYWFREDVYNAPRSYLDLTLQYRLRVSGAQRARGVFLNSTLSY